LTLPYIKTCVDLTDLISLTVIDLLIILNNHFNRCWGRTSAIKRSDLYKMWNQQRELVIWP